MTGNLDRYRFAFGMLGFLDSLDPELTDVVPLSKDPARSLVSHPEAVGQIFRADRGLRVEGTSTLGPLVGEQSLLFANGSRHDAYRKAIGPALRGNALRGYQPVIQAAVEAAVRRLRPGDVIVLPEWTREITLGIIAEIVLGEVDRGFLGSFTGLVESALGARLRTLLYRYARYSTRFPSPWRTFLRKRDAVDRELLERVHRMADGGSRCIAGVLMAGEEPLGALADDDLRDQLVSLLFAGHETTASALSWTLFWLDREDEVRRDVLDELAATDSDGSDPGAVPLLEAVCQESLRICPPAMVAGNRVFPDGGEVFGQTLAPGARLTPCIYLAHRRPDTYPDPHRFDPQRFLGRKVSAQEYLPFGGGTRRCLGADLAMLELRMVVAAVLRGGEFRCLNPEQGVPHLRGPAMGPGPDLRMEVRKCPR